MEKHSILFDFFLCVLRILILVSHCSCRLQKKRKANELAELPLVWKLHSIEYHFQLVTNNRGLFYFTPTLCANILRKCLTLPLLDCEKHECKWAPSERNYFAFHGNLEKKIGTAAITHSGQCYTVKTEIVAEFQPCISSHFVLPLREHWMNSTRYSIIEWLSSRVNRAHPFSDTLHKIVNTKSNAK